LAECYGYLMPYSLTPGVFLAFMAGLCWRGAWSDRFARWFWGLLALAGALLAAAQAAFGIFEFRYMLPLAAFVAPAAGAEMVRIEAALAERKRLASLIQGAILAPALLFSLASLLLQREAFGDIKQAARAAARMAAPDQRVFSNERYNALFSTVKTSYWLGRDALADPEMERFQSLYSAGGDAPGPDAAPFRAGDWLIVSSVYAGGPQMISDYLAWLSERYTLASKGRFDAVITPLLPDLMAIPGTHGSPLAWFYRYAPQHFSTLLIQVQGIRQ